MQLHQKVYVHDIDFELLISSWKFGAVELMPHLHRRHEILKANKRYQLEIEKNRAHSALQTLPVNQQVNLRQHLASINADLLALTRKGSPVP